MDLNKIPTYLRATLLTTASVAILPGFYLWTAYTDYLSPSWDTNGDSGAAQGQAILAAASMQAIVFSLIAFPLLAYYLNAKRKWSPKRFYGYLFKLLALLSLLLGLAISLVLSGGYREFFVLGLMHFIISSLLALPYAHLWVKLSQ